MMSTNHRLSSRSRALNALALLGVLVVGANRFFVLHLFGGYEKVANIVAIVFLFVVIYFTTGKVTPSQPAEGSSESIDPARGMPNESESVTPFSAWVIVAIVLSMAFVSLRIIVGEMPKWWLIALTELIVVGCLVKTWRPLKREAAEFQRKRKLKKLRRKKSSD